MIKKRSNILCDGHLVPMGKPGKDPKDSPSYRPVTLFSVYRKTLSTVIIGRIDEQLERALAGTQYAYRKNRSTEDVAIAHKYLLAAAKRNSLEIISIGIDMSKAFDTVNRQKLITILKEKDFEEGDISLIEILLNNTTLRIKRGKEIGNPFKTTIGVPQGDGLSPKLFTLYLNEALNEINAKIDQLNREDHDYFGHDWRPNTYGHDYARRPQRYVPLHIEYADDVDFLCSSKEEAPRILRIAKTVLGTYNLMLNETKTEIIEYKRAQI